ncbi:unnamed protein product [Nippostrongylus brasiliensis]|uniref:Uncharacterized protein n=1 Tax=Nippostrongylus brasiliensis TaxID=27835 RepID=A0A158R059_NIPBR|nr:unnamed protein product [Nippostrongylus brasiliensis]
MGPCRFVRLGIRCRYCSRVAGFPTEPSFAAPIASSSCFSNKEQKRTGAELKTRLGAEEENRTGVELKTRLGAEEENCSGPELKARLGAEEEKRPEAELKARLRAEEEKRP